MSDSAIVDRYGRTFSSAGLYRTPSSNPNGSRAKPELRKRTFENVTPMQRRDLINWCWGIYGKIPNVAAALDFKTDFACSDGCYVQYQGTNKEWGKRLEASMNDSFYANCNLAGENHDFHTTLAAISIAFETHGQVGWVFDDSAGKVKIISASSIGNGMSPDSKSGQVFELGQAEGSYSYWGLSSCEAGYSNLLKIEKGPFAGNFIIDGVIVDRNMVTLGYRLIGFNAAGQPAYADMPVAQMGMLFEPKFTDQIMGYPGLADLVDAVGTVDDWNYYIGQAMKLSAAMAVTRTSKDGRPALSGVSYSTVAMPTESGGTENRVVAHQVMRAGIVELATDNNEEIKSVPFDRPSMNEEAFIERIETGFFAKHWPREFIYTKGFGRASARIGVVQARQKVWKRHRTLVRFGRQLVRLRTVWEMQRGILPKNDDMFDPFNISLSTPAEISVDEGNDGKLDLAMLGRGATSHKIICAKAGRDETQVDEDNFNSLTRRLNRAKAIHKSGDNLDESGMPILSVKEILARIDNLGNANQPVDMAAPEAEEKEGKTSGDDDDDSPPSPPTEPKTIIIRRTDTALDSQYTIES